MQQDLPPDTVDATLLAYLQQMIDHPGDPSANPRRLVSLVAHFEDDAPHAMAAPGRTVEPYAPRLPGAPLIADVKAVLREEHVSATSYVQASGAVCIWMIVNGVHKKFC